MIMEPGPGFSVQDVSNGLSEGFRLLGHQVGTYDLHNRLNFYRLAHVPRSDNGEWQQCFEYGEALRQAVRGAYSHLYEFVPDIVVIVSGFYAPQSFFNLLRARGHKIVLWMTESPYEDTLQLQRAPYADLVILNDPTNLPAFRAVQPNSHYIGHAYNPAIHTRTGPDPTKTSDFFWVGTAFPSRKDFFEQIDWRNLNVKLGGNWELLGDQSQLWPYLISDKFACLDNADAVAWYSNTKASANIYRREYGDGDIVRPADAGWAMGPREVELAALGTFFLTEQRGENREVLPMVPTFDGPDDFTEKLHWWLAHDDARDEVAAKAREAIADRTFEANAARSLELLDL